MFNVFLAKKEPDKCNQLFAWSQSRAQRERPPEARQERSQAGTQTRQSRAQGGEKAAETSWEKPEGAKDQAGMYDLASETLSFSLWTTQMLILDWQGILYLMIVNMPSGNDMNNARRLLGDEWSG